MTGCNQGPGGPWQVNAPQQQQLLSQLNEINRQKSSLNDVNNGLHAEVAKWQQKAEYEKEMSNKLSRQLTDTANQLKEAQLALQDAERRVEAIQASTRYRGGATIKANNSLSASLQMISIPGVEIRRDTDVIRIELPADRLFVQGTAQLQGSAPYLLDQVADAIARHYPRQQIGIEAHTDAAVAPSTAVQQLTTGQALAVYNVLTTRNRLPAQQLFTIAHGANHPLASNATVVGRAKNRRLEIVIYPETIESL